MTIVMPCDIRMPFILKVKFIRVSSLVDWYFYNMYIVKIIEIVFSFNVKNNSIFPCLRNIRFSYNIQKCFSAFVNQNTYVYIRQ